MTMLGAADPWFVYGNIGEGVLWAAIGGFFVQRAFCRAGLKRVRCALARFRDFAGKAI